MTYLEALKEIKKNQLHPFYLLYGTEQYLLDDILQKIVQAALPEEEHEVNLSIFDLEETAIQDVIMDAETFPFFGERKVLICKSPTFLKPKPDKLQIEHNIETLQTYVASPVDFSIIIFVASFEKVDERKKIVKLLKKNGSAVHCEPPKERDIHQWITALAKELNITIERQAEAIIAEEIGTNLLGLKSELEKMALYAGDERVITAEIAELLISRQTSSSALKMVDSIMNKDLAKTLSIFKDLQKQNEEPIALLALIASQFRLIFQSKTLKSKGYTQAQIAQQIKAHPYAVKMAMQRERGFSNEQLGAIIHELANTDAKMKQGKMEKNLAFDLLLYRLIEVTKEPASI